MARQRCWIRRLLRGSDARVALSRRRRVRGRQGGQIRPPSVRIRSRRPSLDPRRQGGGCGCAEPARARLWRGRTEAKAAWLGRAETVVQLCGSGGAGAKVEAREQAGWCGAGGRRSVGWLAGRPAAAEAARARGATGESRG
uniref:Uncharacterized protein n=1 Tax=Oryza nivara TaxID=4536 RepID=A0A0E0FRQ8_ORYNI